VDELMTSGALDDPTGLTKDDITRQLEALSSGGAVDDQLAKMKLELSGGGNKALESGAGSTSYASKNDEISDADVLKDGGAA
jgi:phage shock protein A